MTAVAGDPHVAGLRADTRASLISLAYALAAAARPDATTSTNWRELAQITGLARATVARHLARLREWELLALVWSTSMSPGHRWSARDHEHVARNQGNQAAVYLLTRPERGLETAD